MEQTNTCRLCPRACGVDRRSSTGFCGMGDRMRVARAALHKWEEPPISGTNGSGAIFFSGCTLRCCFCQNYQISAEGFGKEISVTELCDIMVRLQEQGAHNINLVTPTQFADKIAAALDRIRGGKLHIPVVYNSSGYETEQTLAMLNGYIDVYLPDLKYVSPELSARYSAAADYFSFASRAIVQMQRQAGPPVFDKSGLLKKGVVVRHMVLPGAYRDSLAVIDWLARQFGREDVLFSLMCQYTPQHKSTQFPEIDRRLTTFEYRKAADRAAELGLRGYMQERSAASTDYIPAFDLSGIEK